MLAYLAAVTLFLGLLALPADASAQAAPGQERRQMVGVDAVREEPMSQTIDVLGRLVAHQGGAVAARVAERVASVEVEVGDRVAEG